MSILSYAPDDLTVVVSADTTLAALQSHLAEHHQWLPIDPFDPARLTIGRIVDENLSGPRRYGYGTIREHILSMRAQFADGRMIKSGADVVKNAAGYDLCRLFTGARGELATVREVCFKVQPRPECERFVCASFVKVEEAWKLVEAVDTSPLTPVVLDLHHLPGNAHSRGPWVVVIGFAGMEEEVEWQRAEVGKLAAISDTDLSYDGAFWSAGVWSPLPRASAPSPAGAEGVVSQERSSPVGEGWGEGLEHESRAESGPHPSPLPAAMEPAAQVSAVGAAGRGRTAAPVRKISVLPSTLLDTIRRLSLQDIPLLARAGNGILYCRGPSPQPSPGVPGEGEFNPQSAIRNPQSLFLRLKHEFDPDHKLTGKL